MSNILVVDDTPDNLRLLVGILTEHGYEVRAASEGEFGLESARSTPPDLILLDIKMPGMDGYAVCKELKADESTRDIPVIFISALNEVIDKVKGFEVGGVDYITQPFEVSEVLARVETHVAIYALSLKKDSYGRILNNLHDGLYFVDRNRVITYWNKAAEQISGFAANEVVGTHCSDNILTHVDHEGNNICTGTCPLAATMSDGESRDAHVYMHHKNGHRIPVSVRVSTLTDRNGNIIGGVELFTDISNQAANELRIKELEKLVLLDNLTQLANRNYIEKEIQNRFEEKKRFNIPFGILFIDIDHFKKFNDTYGHDVGDNVLKFVANTFVTYSRPFDLYGRWGGEEFIGIIRNINGEDLELLGNRLLFLIKSSYIIHKNEKLSVTISIGATLIHENDTVDTFIKRADTLLYKSKEAGRNCLRIG